MKNGLKYAEIRPQASAVGERGNNRLHKGRGIEISRRRVAVSVACDRCRQRKIRCNGNRPVCSNCLGQTSHCGYRDESPLSPQSQKAILKMVDLLNRIPVAKAIRALKLLKNEKRADKVVSVLEREASVRQDIMDASTADSNLEPVFESSLKEYGLATPDNAKTVTPKPPAVATSTFDPALGNYAVSLLSGPDQARQRTRREPEACSPLHSQNSSTAFVAPGPPPVAPDLHRLQPSSFEHIPRKVPHHVTWTELTGDIELVRHLLDVYFCWEYPCLAPFNKEYFLRDFEEGENRYCSSILVNALLAVGCGFSTQCLPQADTASPHSSGDLFFDEAQRLFYREANHYSLTTVQALGLFSIREATRGRDSHSSYYANQSIQMAIEMGLHKAHLDMNDFPVASATFWGAFNLAQAWSVVISSLPHCSQVPQTPPKPQVNKDIELSLWMPITDEGKLLRHQCTQSSNTLSVYNSFCELSEIVHQSLYLLWSPVRRDTPSEITHIYTSYLLWYGEIPAALRLGQNSTPAVLFMHMYYHFAILKLFEPFISVDFTPSTIIPLNVCFQASDAIQALVKSYSSLYTLRRVPTFLSTFIFASAAVHVNIGLTGTSPDTPSETVEVRNLSLPVGVEQSIAALSEIATSQPYAEKALNDLTGVITNLSLV